MALNLAPVPKENAVTNNGLVGPVWFNWLNTLRVLVLALSGAVRSGTGSPAGVVIADRGTLWLRTDGGAGTTLYVKEGNDGTVNGWTAK